jgi:hypothetical protein
MNTTRSVDPNTIVINKACHQVLLSEVWLLHNAPEVPFPTTVRAKPVKPSRYGHPVLLMRWYEEEKESGYTTLSSDTGASYEHCDGLVGQQRLRLGLLLASGPNSAHNSMLHLGHTTTASKRPLPSVGCCLGPMRCCGGIVGGMEVACRQSSPRSVLPVYNTGNFTFQMRTCGQRPKRVEDRGPAYHYHSMTHPTAYHRLRGLSDISLLSTTARTLISSFLDLVTQRAQVGQEGSAEPTIVTMRRVLP